MEWLLQLLITPLILWVASQSMSGVHIKNFKAAIWTSLSIIVAGWLVGWLFTFLLNLATLGLFWLVGLGVITRIVAYAIIIEIIDQVRDDFDTRGFLPSLWLSIWLAVGWGIIDYIF